MGQEGERLICYVCSRKTSDVREPKGDCGQITDTKIIADIRSVEQTETVIIVMVHCAGCGRDYDIALLKPALAGWIA
jgi:hypothetical protein